MDIEALAREANCPGYPDDLERFAALVLREAAKEPVAFDLYVEGRAVTLWINGAERKTGPFSIKMVDLPHDGETPEPH
jgi:hypothetical protein